jgi:uncharacterized protein YndB with AHSA1/START domain
MIGGMTTTTETATTQIYQVFIKATPDAIWEAITTPSFTARYFHGARIELVDGAYQSHGPDGSQWADEPVFECSPPRRLVHGWRSLYNDQLAVEPASRVTWEIEDAEEGVCKLTVTHDQLEHSPLTAGSVAGAGWMLVLSGLKTLLETGEPLFA